MADFIMLMHKLPDGADEGDWDAYLAKLSALGVLRGGSAIGDGQCFRKSGNPPAVTAHLNGFIRIDSADLAAAAQLLDGNPVYEAGGAVEIRALPITA